MCAGPGWYFALLYAYLKIFLTLDHLITVIGPNAVNSDYDKAEWEHALLFAKRIVPISFISLKKRIMFKLFKCGQLVRDST